MSHRVGAATVTRIEECPFAVPARFLLPDWNPEDEAAARLSPADLDPANHTLTMSIHTWLIRDAGRTILIDTGIGNAKTRQMSAFSGLDTPFLARLAAAGVQPEDVTHVIMTHLHVDHVGWNTRRQGEAWVPTFRNARHVIAPQAVTAYAAAGGADLRGHDVYLDSVAPIADAGLLDLAPAAGGAILDGIVLHPTPGHSIDHMTVELTSAGEIALFPGDILHHPVQMARPAWCSVFDADPERTRASRHLGLGRAVETGALYFSSHFGGTPVGRVARAADGYSWTPVA